MAVKQPDTATPKLVAISRERFALWKEMRCAIYPMLDDAYHDEEMNSITANPVWHCRFIENGDGEIVGMVELSLRNIVDNCLSSPVAYLEGLYIQPQHQGKGLGRRVIELIKQWCADNGLAELATDAELGNIRAQNFYRSLGFEETDRVVEYRIAIDKP